MRERRGGGREEMDKRGKEQEELEEERRDYDGEGG